MATRNVNHPNATPASQPIIPSVEMGTIGEEKVAQMQAYDAGRGMHLTAQYLYDQLVDNGQAERTRMEIVKQAVDTIDTANFKKLLADMVELAKKIPDEKIKKAKYKTAQNTQTVLRAAYGAIKFAPVALAEEGYNPASTGYNDMAVYSKNALKKANITWEGIAKISADQKALDKKQVEDELVLTKLKKDFPRLKTEDGKDFAESAFDYNERILAKLDAAIEQHAKDTMEARIEAACRDIIKNYPTLLDGIGDQLYIVLDKVTAEAQEAAEKAAGLIDKAALH